MIITRSQRSSRHKPTATGIVPRGARSRGRRGGRREMRREDPPATLQISTDISSSSQAEVCPTQAEVQPTQAVVQPTQADIEASTVGSRARKRTRGPNRCIALNDRQDRIVIEYNEYNQPIGQSERLLSSYLGIIARDGQKTPINYADWRRIPAEMKEEMWEVVQLKFDIDNRAKKWVFNGISHSWRNWKSELKRKYYDPFPIVEEQLQHCPNRVDRQQWVSLVEFWGSQEGVERSKRNTENRAKQTMNHTAGTRSFARIREEERARNPNGQAPDRIEVFRLTHTRRDGQPVDQAAEDALRQLNERMSQQPESSQSSTARNDIFTQVMGEDRRGRVRTFGLGVAPSDIYGPRLSAPEARRMAEDERAKRIESEQSVVALKEQMDQMKTRMSRIETLLHRFTESDSGQPSSSSEHVFGAPLDDIQRDG
eukprot:TRINITY_DN5113_c1_g1_i2.p1 TRINITY_DN5113_c1_g1~~TRINITY_DN5113_c1_g1_i2.p1  ORF type:complete len:427 (+),score=59.74 TRINITY_DN5113_c1_g1_i2:167-1447(+)